MICLTLALFLDNHYKNIDTFIRNLGVEISKHSRQIEWLKQKGRMGEDVKVWKWLEQNYIELFSSDYMTTDKFRFALNDNFVEKQTRQYFWNSANTKHIFGIDQTM